LRHPCWYHRSYRCRDPLSVHHTGAFVERLHTELWLTLSNLPVPLGRMIIVPKIKVSSRRLKSVDNPQNASFCRVSTSIDQVAALMIAVGGTWGRWKELDTMTERGTSAHRPPR
jgi:hypothetical protein